jgi:hypothetical protein
MGNKRRGEPRVGALINKLILSGLSNLDVLAQVRATFPQHRTSPEQVRFKRSQMRARHGNKKQKYVPTSVEARRSQQTKRGEGGPRR